MSLAQADFVNLEDAVATISSGSSLVITGAMSNAPMALVRELIRQKKTDLHVTVSPVGGINVDLLIGAGAVRSVEFPQISLGEFGLAPNFRRAAEKGSIKLFEHT